MNIFKEKKKVEFFAAVCPKCGGNLEFDANMETAYCSKCGLRCLVDENISKRAKFSPSDKLIGFLERQQNIIRENKKRQALVEQEEQAKLHHWVLKNWWILLLVFTLIMAFLMLMTILEKNGII